jgi:hypothetical protein
MALSTPRDVSTVMLAAGLEFMTCVAGWSRIYMRCVMEGILVLSLPLCPYEMLGITVRVGSQWPALYQPYREIMK